MKTVGIFALAGCIFMSACAGGLGQSQILGDDKIVSETAGVLGKDASDLTLSDRRSSGLNTYYSVTTSSGEKYNCVLNGGTVLSLGLTNPPLCAHDGEPLPAPGFR